MKVHIMQFKNLSINQKFWFLSQIERREVDSEKNPSQQIHVKLSENTYAREIERTLPYQIGSEKLLVAVKIEDLK
jgi:tRNA U55 pseudouridine synthase TruB